MTTKWNALALGLAAMVIFSAGKTQAQENTFGFTPGEILVTRVADDFIISSNPLQEPTGVCEFEFPIRILDIDRGVSINVGDFGVIDGDGLLTTDADALLAALGSRAAKFAMFCTSCGTNTGDYGAQALRHHLQVLEQGESVTLHTVLISQPDCSGVGCCGP
jgi:hypothetical protein